MFLEDGFGKLSVLWVTHRLSFFKPQVRPYGGLSQKTPIEGVVEDLVWVDGAAWGSLGLCGGSMTLQALRV